MSGLIIKIEPGERFVVNGAVLENGDRPARLRINDNSVRVLRCRDALRPEDVTTPVRRIYYAIQLIITGDLKEADVLPALGAACAELTDIFAPIDPTLIPVLQSMLGRGNYYSAICHMRPLLAIEAHLLAGRDAVPLAGAA